MGFSIVDTATCEQCGQTFSGEHLCPATTYCFQNVLTNEEQTITARTENDAWNELQESVSDIRPWVSMGSEQYGETIETTALDRVRAGVIDLDADTDNSG